LFANVVFVVVVSFKLSNYKLKQVTIGHVWWVLLWTCII
jgi:hypothetical protein